MKNSVFILAYLFAAHAFAQTCLQKLDSAELFKYSNQEKAKFYASSLLTDLDSARCLSEIGIAGAYNNIGLIFWEANDKPKGLHAFHSGLTHELKNKDSTHRELLGLYYNLSSLYQEIGAYTKAEKYIDLAERVVNTSYAGETNEQLKFLYLKGVYYREVGDFNKSLNTLQKAIELNGKSNLDSTGIALQIELGTTYRHFGDLKQSEVELLKAVEQSKETNELQYLTAIDRLSSLKIEQGEYSESENYLLYNLERKKEKYASDSLLILETLNGLSVLYYKLNDLNSANDYMNQALKTTGDIRNLRPFLVNNLGTIYMKMGDIDNALLCFQESSEGFRELYGSMNPDYASSINNLAGIYKMEGLLGEALNLYTKVLDMDKVIYGAKHQRYATSLNNVALVYLQLVHFSLAGKLLNQAKEIRQEALGDYHPLYIKTLNDLGVYYL
ncbi:MAG: tetratricopeptide repeat protein, partial [Bacteroidota bacterium]